MSVRQTGGQISHYKCVILLGYAKLTLNTANMTSYDRSLFVQGVSKKKAIRI